MPINAAPAHLQIVRDILRAHLPAEAQVWVFGSRITERVKQFSDLDLAVDAGRVLTADESGSLQDEFTESDLPWKVDVVDWHRTEAYFRKIIEAARVFLPLREDDWVASQELAMNQMARPIK